MSASSMSLKAKINNYAKQHRIAPQVVLQKLVIAALKKLLAQ